MTPNYIKNRILKKNIKYDKQKNEELILKTKFINKFEEDKSQKLREFEAKIKNMIEEEVLKHFNKSNNFIEPEIKERIISIEEKNSFKEIFLDIVFEKVTKLLKNSRDF